MLDTSDGTVTKYVVTGPVYPDPPGRYAADDPRAWRDEWCDDWTVPVEELTREWADKHRSLRFVGMPGRLPWPGVLIHPDKEDGWMWRETTAMRRIYHAHEWPDHYRGHECREAVSHWWKNGKSSTPG
ncbi:hypothetical protein GGR56DRAFT_660913 [Xylariaceae sp. FL0804]|nr:hypothetical protein GGR56DRAFT_660913 [Xylariaceae sp. FL0804]